MAISKNKATSIKSCHLNHINTIIGQSRKRHHSRTFEIGSEIQHFTKKGGGYSNHTFQK